MATYDYLCKLIIFGDHGVGRTTLEKYLDQIHPIDRRFFQPLFESQDRSVTGVNYHKKLVEIRRNRLTLQIWVLGNQERFRDLRKMYVKGSSGSILMYDITNASSLSRIPEWCEMIAEHCGEIPILLIGNKLDLEEQRAISEERGREVQRKNNLSSFMEISAETGENVEKMFELIGELLLNNSLNNL